jgi:hypothetical protein
LAEAHPHLTGTGFDLPPVASSFRRYVRSRGLEDRLKFVEGDFTADLLPHADVVVMGHLLPDWDERRKLLLLERAYEALPKGGALVTYDAIIDSEREKNTFGLLMSLNMVVETRGGFEYTVAQFHQWTSAAGFSESRIEPLGGAYSMGVAIK